MLARKADGLCGSYNNATNKGSYVSQQSNSGDTQQINFNASLLNTAFGASSNVQMPAIQALVAIRY